MLTSDTPRRSSHHRAARLDDDLDFNHSPGLDRWEEEGTQTDLTTPINPDLPPLTLPLPGPRLLRRTSSSEHSDQSEEIRTPAAPHPPPPLCHHHGPPRAVAGADCAHRHALQRHPDVHLAQHRLRDVAAIIEQVHISYSRLKRRVQSPIIVASLADFRHRVRRLSLSRMETGDKGLGYDRCEDLAGQVDDLEDDWWSSEVVANWFGPQPHIVKRQQCTRPTLRHHGSGGKPTKTRGKRNTLGPSGRQDGGNSSGEHPGDGIDVVMSERADEIRRVASVVGL